MTEDATEDPRFVERLRRREEAAFTQLVRTYEGRIIRFITRMVGNRSEAEELAQEVFLNVFRSVETFRGESKLSTWLYRIAANVTKNRIKYLSRRADGRRDEFADEEGIAGTGPARPDELVEAKETGAQLEQALAALDEEQRILVVLRDLENLSYEEIQTATGLAEGTVKSRLHRARQALFSALGARGKAKP